MDAADYVGVVLSRAAKLGLLFLLVISLGGQWALLQSVAWTGMLINYSRDGSIKEAVCKTFDGKHPCCLCKAIAAGKKSDQKQKLSTSFQRLEFPPLSDAPTFVSRVKFPPIVLSDVSGKSLVLKPLTPPPRNCAVKFI